VIVARYIFKEHIGPFFFGFAVITLVLVMDFILEVMQSIITKGVGAWEVLEIFGLNLAWMLALSVPMSVLVGTIMAYGRLELAAAFRAGFNRGHGDGDFDVFVQQLRPAGVQPRSPGEDDPAGAEKTLGHSAAGGFQQPDTGIPDLLKGNQSLDQRDKRRPDFRAGGADGAPNDFRPARLGAYPPGGSNQKRPRHCL